MLTDKEREHIWNDLYPDGDRLSCKLDAYARAIERAVLAKAMPIPKKEPIGKVCKSAECGGIDFYFDKIPDGETMLYAEPQPAQAAAMPEDIEILIAEVKQQFMWRMEDSECGGDEIIESWDKTEFSIRSRLSSASPKPE